MFFRLSPSNPNKNKMEDTLRYSPNAVFIRKSELATAYP